ncbi:hypothetical protein ABT072_36305 [Streptomyces sp. NPDC002589]
MAVDLPVGELEAEDRDVLRTEVAGVEDARLQGHVAEGDDPAHG